MNSTRHNSSLALIYARVSTGAQETDGTSLDTQVEAGTARAKQLGFNGTSVSVVREQHTGSELYERPLLTEVRETIKRGEIKTLIVYALDRLARNPIHQFIVIEECERHDVEFICITEPIDKSDTGELIAYARGWAARSEREKIKERSIRGRIAKAKSGKVVGLGSDLYGYTLDRQTWKRGINEAQAVIVRRIFKQIAEGASARNVALQLDADGVLTPSQHRTRGFVGRGNWQVLAVTRIVRDARYKGIEVANIKKWERKNGKRVITARPVEEQIIVDAGTPAIVDEALWHEANARMEKRGASYRHNQRYQYLLSGMTICACGGRMHGGYNKQSRASGKVYHYPIYRCSAKRSGNCRAPQVNAPMVEAEAWRQVAIMLADPQYLKSEIQRRQGRELNNDPLREEAERAEKHVATLETQRERMTRRMASVEDDEVAAILQADLTALGKQLRAARVELDAARQRFTTRTARKYDAERLLDACAQLGPVLEQWPWEKRRLALEALDVRVEVAAGKVEVGIPVLNDQVQCSVVEKRASIST